MGIEKKWNSPPMAGSCLSQDLWVGPEEKGSWERTSQRKEARRISPGPSFSSETCSILKLFHQRKAIPRGLDESSLKERHADPSLTPKWKAPSPRKACVLMCSEAGMQSGSGSVWIWIWKQSGSGSSRITRVLRSQQEEGGMAEGAPCGCSTYSDRCRRGWILTSPWSLKSGEERCCTMTLFSGMVSTLRTSWIGHGSSESRALRGPVHTHFLHFPWHPSPPRLLRQ